MKRKKVLYLSPRFTYPLIGGDRIKTYHLLSHLAKSYDVTYVTLAHAKLPEQKFIKLVEDLGIEVYAIPFNPIFAGLKSGLSLFQKYPLEILFYHNSKMFKLVDELHKEKGFDLAIAFFMRTAEYVKNLNSKKILISEDCRVLYQGRSAQSSKNILQKMIRLWEVLKLKNYEKDIVNNFDTVTLVTNDDINAMKEGNPDVRYRLLTNGADLNRFAFNPDTTNRKNLVITGKLDIWANQIMIHKIAKEILPKIREKLPEVCLQIVGSYPTTSVLNLQNDYIKIHTNVPEIAPYLQNGACFVHPHEGATGIQNKLLEAMSCGIPVITTNTGNQGINARHGIEAMIANSTDEFVNFAIELITHTEKSALLIKNARKLIEETHSWNFVFDQLDSIINEVFDEK